MSEGRSKMTKREVGRVSGSRERPGESQPIVLGLFIRKLISFGFGGREEEVRSPDFGRQ